MADIKFSQFTNTPTPNANSYFVGYNSVTGINGRTTLTDLITAIGAPSGSGTANFVSKWSGTNTLTDSLFYSDANVAKTIYGGNDKGLFIDFVNSITSLANNQGFGLIANPWDLYLGDFNDLQYSTTLQILDANRVIKTRDYVGDRGFYLDFENYLFSFGTQQKGFNVNLTNLKYTLGDFGSSNNSTTFQVDDLNQIIKTTNNGENKGLYLDFTNNVYLFGNSDNVPNQLYIYNNEIILGDVYNNVNSTKFIVDDSVQIIKTSSQGADKGLLLNFANNQYSLGDYDGAVNGITLLVNDAAQLISFFSPRVQYTGQDSATIAAFTGNAAGQLAYDSDLNSFQYYNGSAWAAVAPKTTYMMTGVFTNMFGGDPGGLGKDILDWVGSTPAASHSSALPILQNCRITAAGFKWISSTPIATIAPGDSWTIQVFKMINPLTASTTADGNFTLVGNLNITLTSANSGTTPGVFSSGLDLILNAGDIIRIAGVETGTIGTTTEEAQLTVLFELI